MAKGKTEIISISKDSSLLNRPERELSYNILPPPTDLFSPPTLLCHRFDAAISLIVTHQNIESGVLTVKKGERKTTHSSSKSGKTKTEKVKGGGLLDQLMGAPKETQTTWTPSSELSSTQSNFLSTQREVITNVTNISPEHINMMIEYWLNAKNGDTESPSLLNFAESSHRLRASTVMITLHQIASAAENLRLTEDHSNIKTTMNSQHDRLMSAIIRGTQHLVVNALEWDLHLASDAVPTSLREHLPMLQHTNERDLFSAINLLCDLSQMDDPSTSNKAHEAILEIADQVFSQPNPELITKFLETLITQSETVGKKDQNRSLNRAQIRNRKLIGKFLIAHGESRANDSNRLTKTYVSLCSEKSLTFLLQAAPSLSTNSWLEVVREYEEILKEEKKDRPENVSQLTHLLVENTLYKHIKSNISSSNGDINKLLEPWKSLVNKLFSEADHANSFEDSLHSQYGHHLEEIIPGIVNNIKETTNLKLIIADLLEPLTSKFRAAIYKYYDEYYKYREGPNGHQLGRLSEMFGTIQSVLSTVRSQNLDTVTLQDIHQSIMLELNTGYSLNGIVLQHQTPHDLSSREGHNSLLYSLKHESPILFFIQQALDDNGNQELPPRLSKLITPDDWKIINDRVSNLHSNLFPKIPPLQTINNIDFSARRKDLRNYLTNQSRFLLAQSLQRFKLNLISVYLITGMMPEDVKIDQSEKLITEYIQDKITEIDTTKESRKDY